jgi:hypothetical protein
MSITDETPDLGGIHAIPGTECNALFKPVEPLAITIGPHQRLTQQHVGQSIRRLLPQRHLGRTALMGRLSSGRKVAR